MDDTDDQRPEQRARAERARRLRSRIASLKDEPAPPTDQESPREFIHRRMREVQKREDSQD
jgi:hypothetical protein